jgi:hypothetical protein
MNTTTIEGTCERSWLKHYATNRRVAGSSLDEVIEFFQFTLSFQPQYGPGVYSASNRNECQKMFLGSRARPARKADNLIAICEPIV